MLVHVDLSFVFAVDVVGGTDTDGEMTNIKASLVVVLNTSVLKPFD